MKLNRSIFHISILFFIIVTSCSKEKFEDRYDAKIQIDSIKQDTFIFANQYIYYDKVKVYFTVINNDNIDIHCYRYTVNAMTCDSAYFQIRESHYNTVAAQGKFHDSTKIGIGNSKAAYARIDNLLFQ